MKIIYEDTDIIVAYKPANMLTQSDAEGNKGLLEELSEFYKQPIYLIHRLDYGVSGLLVFARNSKMAAELSKIVGEHDFVKESLGGGVTRVRLSRKLSDLPCCLTTEGGVTLEMEKYFRHGPSEEMRNIRANRVLELNPEHRAFAALKEAFENDREKAANLSKILETMAEMMAGCDIEDPAAFVAQVSELF